MSKSMKPAVATVFVFLSIFVLGVQGQYGKEEAGDRTITKVVKLLRKMLTKSQTEGEAEQRIYTKFMCFCDDNKAEKQGLIDESQKTIEYLEFAIESANGAVGQAKDNMELRKDEMNDVEFAKQNSENEHRNFMRKNKYELKQLYYNAKMLNKSIEVLTAIGADQTIAKRDSADSDKFLGGFNLSLASKHTELSKTLRAASAAMSNAQRGTVESFLQAPFTGTYTSQSAEVLGLLTNMQKENKQDIQDKIANIAKADEEAKKFVAISEREIGELDNSAMGQKTEAALTFDAMKTAKVELTQEKKALEQIENYMDRLLPMCEDKARSYANRKLLRTNEEAAIAQAISILSSDASFQAFSETTATNDGGPAIPGTFLQVRRLRGHAPVSDKQQVTKLLQQAAVSAKSTRLDAVASKLEAGNPFTAVLLEIKNMQGVIREEGKRDAQKKEACDTNLENIEDDIETKESDLSKSQLGLEKTTDKIEREKTGVLALISKTERQLNNYTNSQTKLTSIRTQENLQYQSNIKSLEDAEIILTKAIKVLATYYDDLEAKIKNKEANLLQQPYSLSLPKGGKFGGDSATWSGNFTGQSEDGDDAVSLLRTILKNTQKEQAAAHAGEDKAQTKFEDAMALSKTKEAEAETRLAAYQLELAEKGETKLGHEEDVKTRTDELEALWDLQNKTLDECNFILKHHKERISSRDVEYKALERAHNMIKDTPAYKEAAKSELIDSFGDCKTECIKDKTHAKCLACKSEVTVVAYCTGHTKKKGGRTLTPKGCPCPPGARCF